MLDNGGQKRLINLFQKGDKNSSIGSFFKHRNPEDIDAEFELTFRNDLHDKNFAKEIEKLIDASNCRLRPVHMAVMMDDLATVELLLTQGAELEHFLSSPKPSSGWLRDTYLRPRPSAVCTALHLAIALNRLNIFEALVRAGALIYTNGNNREMNAMDYALHENNFDAVKILLDQPLPTTVGLKCSFSLRAVLVQVKNIDEGTSIIGGSWDIVKKFLRLVPSIMDDGDESGTLLQALITNMNMNSPEALEVLNGLVANDYDFKKRHGFYKDTYLHIAMNSAVVLSPQLVLFLLGQGLDVNVKNKRGESPLHHLMFYGHDNSDITTNMFKILVEQKADFYSATNSGLDTFRSAVVHGMNNFVELFVNMNYNEKSPLMETPFQFYVRRGIIKEETVNVFINAGYATDCVDINGQGLLHTFLGRFCWSDEKKRFRCLEDLVLLRKHGVSLTARNGQGRTPLMAAVSKKLHLDIVRGLITDEASARAVDSDGATALDIAMRSFPADTRGLCDDVIKTLVTAGCRPKLEHIFTVVKAEDLRILDALLYQNDLIEEIKTSYPWIMIDMANTCFRGNRSHLVLPIFEKLVTIYDLDVNFVHCKKSLLHRLIKETCSGVKKNERKVLTWVLNQSNLNLETKASMWELATDFTPLEYAFFVKNLDVIPRLVDLSAKGSSEIVSLALDSSVSIMTPIMKYLYTSGHKGLVATYVRKALKSRNWGDEFDASKLEKWIEKEDSQGREAPVAEEEEAEGDVSPLSTLAAQQVRSSLGEKKSAELADANAFPESVGQVLGGKDEQMDE